MIDDASSCCAVPLAKTFPFWHFNSSHNFSKQENRKAYLGTRHILSFVFSTDIAQTNDETYYTTFGFLTLRKQAYQDS